MALVFAGALPPDPANEGAGEVMATGGATPTVEPLLSLARSSSIPGVEDSSGASPVSGSAVVMPTSEWGCAVEAVWSLESASGTRIHECASGDHSVAVLLQDDVRAPGDAAAAAVSLGTPSICGLRWRLLLFFSSGTWGVGTACKSGSVSVEVIRDAPLGRMD